MALGQSLKDAHEYLSELSVEQLRSLLTEQYRSGDIDVALIKKINAVLESKTEIEHRDPEEAYQDFLENYAGTEPMYEEDAADFEESEEARNNKSKHAKRRIRFGLILAAVLVLFLATYVAANAMGLNLWRVFARWTNDTIGLSNSFIPSDDYSVLRDKLNEFGIKAQVVPTYVPEGYSIRLFSFEDTFEGEAMVLLLGRAEDTILLRYILADDVPDVYFAKDDGEPEEYCSGGVTHYLTKNEGQLRASWIPEDGNLVCSITTTEERSELLRIIDSIYQGE